MHRLCLLEKLDAVFVRQYIPAMLDASAGISECFRRDDSLHHCERDGGVFKCVMNCETAGATV